MLCFRRSLQLQSIRFYSLHTAYIALGSNLGDRKKYIEGACDKLDERGIKVVNTSQLYESAPMYVTEQPEFLNAACAVLTTLAPHNLMKACQQIESEMGRIKVVDKGARCIDLDILLYDEIKVNTTDLTIPHIGIAERDFVYLPLSDITNLDDRGIAVPGASLKLHQPHLKDGTNLMLIYNATPDSFSDGEDRARQTISDFLKKMEGVDIIDVGGQSTRPGAAHVSAETELQRVLPVIRGLREAGWQDQISVDTFYATVAKAAVEAGASMVNDISGGQYDSRMLETVAQLGVPIILMHMRGTPQTMQEPENLNYDEDGGVARGMMKELNERYRNAIAAGIRTWNIILDPGISFSKTTEQNLQLLRTPLGGKIPWLVGASRKGFIGKITGVDDPKKRELGTAVCVAASIAQGARIVRVHDAKMREVVRMSDALYR